MFYLFKNVRNFSANLSILTIFSAKSDKIGIQKEATKSLKSNIDNTLLLKTFEFSRHSIYKNANCGQTGIFINVLAKTKQVTLSGKVASFVV